MVDWSLEFYLLAISKITSRFTKCHLTYSNSQLKVLCKIYFKQLSTAFTKCLSVVCFCQMASGLSRRLILQNTIYLHTLTYVTLCNLSTTHNETFTGDCLSLIKYVTVMGVWHHFVCTKQHGVRKVSR